MNIVARNDSTATETTASSDSFISDKACFTTIKADKIYTDLPVNSTDNANVEVIGPVKTILPSPSDAVFTKLSAPCVRLNAENELFLSEWSKAEDDHTILKSGENYVIRTTGTYQKVKNKPDLKISNCTLEITGFEHSYELEEKNGYQPVCMEKIHGAAHVSNGKIYPWSVEMKDYKNLFIMLTKKHGDITFSNKAGDGIDTYLSDLYSSAVENNTPVTITTEWGGWYEVESRPAEFYTGTRNKNSSLVNVADKDRFSVLCNGLQYLKVGYNQKEIAVLFMFMHAGFSNFWFKKAGLGWNMCLIIQGVTNAGKTSVLETAVDVLNSDRKAGLIQLGTSTEAGARRILNTVFRDTFCCYDDFSNADERTSRNAHNLVETALRLIGDGSGRIRAGTGVDVIRETANCVLAVTAEENFQLGASSYTRYLRIFFRRAIKSANTGEVISNGTIDFKALAFYKEHPEIMATYFSLYIKFLTEKGYGIVDYIRLNLPRYRQKFNDFQVGRLVDSAARLQLQSDIIGQFILWCGATAELANTITSVLNSAIESTVRAQEELFQESTPAQVFLKALVNSFDFSKQLAPTEDEYLYASGIYVGFRDDSEGTLWLDKETVKNTVALYLRNEGINFRTPFSNLPKLLHAEGYSKAVVSIKNGKEHYTYLPRSRKGNSGQRRGMLVLYANKLNLFYEED